MMIGAGDCARAGLEDETRGGVEGGRGGGFSVISVISVQCPSVSLKRVGDVPNSCLSWHMNRKRQEVSCLCGSMIMVT